MGSNFHVIGRDKTPPQCGVCNEFFDPKDAESTNGEYFEACEGRTKTAGPFPADLPLSAQSNPYAFCSVDCEQQACEQVGRWRMFEAGELDTDQL